MLVVKIVLHILIFDCVNFLFKDMLHANKDQLIEKCFSIEDENIILKFLWFRVESHLNEHGLTYGDVQDWLGQQKK
jgi:hypothetical protein